MKTEAKYGCCHLSPLCTLRSSALALCYSAAEYCAPVWSRSAHTSRVDVQLNSTMRLISGTLRSTPLPWLPVLSNIEKPAIRRKAATDKLVKKIVKHDSWPDIFSPPLLRLTSRKPLWLLLEGPLPFLPLTPCPSPEKKWVQGSSASPGKFGNSRLLYVNFSTFWIQKITP